MFRDGFLEGFGERERECFEVVLDKPGLSPDFLV